MGGFTIPILQMGKLRHRDVPRIQSRVCWTPEPQLFMPMAIMLSSVIGVASPQLTSRGGLGRSTEVGLGQHIWTPGNHASGLGFLLRIPRKQEGSFHSNHNRRRYLPPSWKADSPLLPLFSPALWSPATPPAPHTH